MMKVVAILETDLSAGGGFNQALNAIRQMARLCQGQYRFEVLTTRRANIGFLGDLGIDAQLTRVGLSDRLLCLLTDNPVWLALQRRIRVKGSIERHLDRIGCDLAYFVVPSALPAALQTTNYLTTVWDLCHRDQPEFPEVRAFGEIQQRERMLRASLPAALAVISDSQLLSERLFRRYGIDPERLLAMPFSPAPHLDSISTRQDPSAISKYHLRPGYFFYPAQLWAHKNHIRILEATALLCDEIQELGVVFAGADKGMRDHLISRANSLNIATRVRFLGFVPGADMAALYQHCRAVLMPTYFGPTNLPPLEAWSFKRPLIYSSHLAEQTGDAALLVDPDDARSVADAMRQCFDDAAMSRLVQLGVSRLSAIDAERQAAEAALAGVLGRFDKRRRCWTSTA